MKTALLLVAFMAFNNYVVAQSNFVFQDKLVGTWHEDSAQRTGLNNFLWSRDVGWFKRQYATLTNWRYEQTIVKTTTNPPTYRITGVKGPRAEVFVYSLKADNETISNIDIGAIGGLRATTAELHGNKLISYLTNTDTGLIDMIATREINPTNPNVMIFKSKDVPYGYEMVSVMLRKI